MNIGEASHTLPSGFNKRDRIAMRAWFFALTDFGDTAVLLPLAVVMLLWLLIMDCSRGAAWWAIAVASCLVMTATLKVSSYGCPLTPDLRSPSGHTSLSTLVYGAMALFTASETAGVRRIMVITGGAGFILGIAASRVLLHIHSKLEICIGLVIGTLALVTFSLRYLRYRGKEMRLLPLFIAVGLLVSVLHGQELGAEEFLRRIAGYLPMKCS